MAIITANIPAQGTDAEGAIQTAINAAAAGDLVIIPDPGYPVVCKAPDGGGNPSYSFTLKSGAASNNRITYQIDGDIQCKAGGFVGTRDCLIGCDKKSFIVINGSGSLDGDNLPTADAVGPNLQFRHLLQMRGANHIKLDGSGGLTMVKGDGGDNLFIGPTELDLDGFYDPCTNIEVTDMLFDSAGRNNVSVTSVENLTMRRCTFTNAVGTQPQAGLCIEPDGNIGGYAVEYQNKARLTNVLVEDCIAHGNPSRGFLVQLAEMRANHAPFDVTLRRCQSLLGATNTQRGFDIRFKPAAYTTSPTGRILLDECLANGLGLAGLYVDWQLEAALLLEIRNSSLYKVAQNSEKAVVIAVAGNPATPATGGVFFNNLRVEEFAYRDAVSFSPNPLTVPSDRIYGKINIIPHGYVPGAAQSIASLPALSIGYPQVPGTLGQLGHLMHKHVGRGRRLR